MMAAGPFEAFANSGIREARRAGPARMVSVNDISWVCDSIQMLKTMSGMMLVMFRCCSVVGMNGIITAPMRKGKRCMTFRAEEIPVLR